MTLQLRPTFSESWYRVVTLKPKLRASAQISRQFYRGERWYVVRDPAGNQFHRLSDAAYKFVGLLDGSRTVGDAWDLVGGQLADDAPTQPEVIQILSQLHAANLLEANVTADAAVLLRRHKQLQKRQLQGRLMNVLFPRIPLWDPDRFLKVWMPVMRVFLSKFGAILGFVWLSTHNGAYPLVSQLSYNAMLIASVSTVIFNANPLLRYDGYYILSDVLEIPNLQQKAKDYSLGIIKRHVFRVKSPI